MKWICSGLIGLGLATGGLSQAKAITVQELGPGPAEVVSINVTGIGNVMVYAGVLKLSVDNVLMDGFCIDPFHFSVSSTPGYQLVSLTSAPKGHLMDATTATEVERLWGSYYAPNMSAQTAAGMQIAIWELTGGNGFHLLSNNDYGAAGFLSIVENPNYNGPVANLLALTGPGQDYGIQNLNTERIDNPVADTGSTLALLCLASCGLFGLYRRSAVLVSEGPKSS